MARAPASKRLSRVRTSHLDWLQVALTFGAAEQPCMQPFWLSSCPTPQGQLRASCARTTLNCTDTTADEDGPHQRDEGLRPTGQYYNCMLPKQQSQLNCHDRSDCQRRTNRASVQHRAQAAKGSTGSRARAYYVRGTGRQGSASLAGIIITSWGSLPLRFEARTPRRTHLPPTRSHSACTRSSGQLNCSRFPQSISVAL